LRDLVEMHCLEQSIDGFAFTDKGKGLLLDFKN
jgi:hypothetical protein